MANVRLNGLKKVFGHNPPAVDIESYTTVLVWCETFGEFISAARYR